MRSRSTRFDRVVMGSHQMLTTVDVLYAGLVVAERLDLVDGAYDFDRTKAVLAQVDLTLAEPALIPAPAEMLTPAGYEVRVRRGIVYGDGTEELLDLGVFPIQRSDFDGVALSASITAYDRSQVVIDARHEDDYTQAAGVNVATAIQTLILDGVPGSTFNLPTTSYTTPAVVFKMGSDRWQNARDLGAAVGWELYYDSLGRCAARTGGLGLNAQWTVAEGAGGALVSAALELDRGPAYNKVVCSGENTTLGAVFTGSAVDDDPASPSYYSGGFGHKPFFHVSPLYASDAQCVTAALARLDNVRGVARSVRIDTLPNPAIEGGDVISIQRAALGLNELHVVDAGRLGLSASGGLSLRTRVLR